jgi:rhodanese-related sulfurtransferase
LDQRKRTDLGLYVTAGEAFELWTAHPDEVNIIDVRTPEEYIFVGHAPMARNIPLAFVEHRWDLEKDEPVVRPNPQLITRVTSLYEPTDTLVVMCRSGGRSALAVNALAKAGFDDVYNVIDGFEGDKVDDPDSLFRGKRLKNGWKNAGAPWTYDCDPALLWIE